MKDYTRLVFLDTSGGRFSVLTGEPTLVRVTCQYPQKKPVPHLTCDPRVVA